MAACGLVLSGCGAQYRPVVSAINPVGPAGQPTKYVIAASNTTPFGATTESPGLITFVDFAGDTVLGTPSVVPFPAPTTAPTATTAATPTYVNPLLFTVSNSGSEAFLVNQEGLFDSFFTSSPTTLLTQDIVPQTLAAGAAPVGVQTFLLPSTGQTIFIPQSGLGTIAELEFSSSASLIQNLAIANPVYTVGVDSNASRVYALSSAGVAYPVENSPVSVDYPGITVGTNPVYGFMTADGKRAFILNKGSSTVSVINVPSNALDSGVAGGTITLPALTKQAEITGWSVAGGVATFTGANTFVAGDSIKLSGFTTGAALNGQTVTVTGTPTTQTFQATVTGIATTTSATEYGVATGSTATIPASPIWADLSPLTSEVVVLEQGDGINTGAIDVIQIPLCNAGSPATNPNCSTTNPVDATGFGTIVFRTRVGVNPSMLSVLNDGTRVYIADSGILPNVVSGLTGGQDGSLSVVNIVSGIRTTRIPATSNLATVAADESNVSTGAAVANVIFGHPNTIVAVIGSPTGKVYTTSTDSQYLSVEETDTEAIRTHISLQGTGIRVLSTAK